jgi:hypothetical protein
MTPANLIILLVALVSLTLLFQVALAGLLFLSWRRFKLDERMIKYAARKTSRQLTDIVVTAQKESKDFLLESQKTAQQQLADLPNFSAILETESHQVIERLLSWQEIELKKLQKTWAEKLAGAAASSQHEMQEELATTIDSFKAELSTTLKQELASLSEERKALITETQQQLKEYTQQQQQQLAAHAESVLPQLLAGTIQKQLSPDQQHDLVMAQLQQAWEDGLLKV